jgi:hypothetical protein
MMIPMSPMSTYAIFAYLGSAYLAIRLFIACSSQLLERVENACGYGFIHWAQRGLLGLRLR